MPSRPGRVPPIGRRRAEGAPFLGAGTSVPQRRDGTRRPRAPCGPPSCRSPSSAAPKATATGARRARAALFEEDGAGRIKVNPLAGWSRADVEAHIARHDLPRHPLVAEGYASIGCAPCSSAVAPGEDERAGRWRDDDKTECGLHLEGGRLVGGGAGAAPGRADAAGPAASVQATLRRFCSSLDEVVY